MITQAELKEKLNYNSETGVFTWKVSTAKRIKVGGVAGSLRLGYIRIKIKGKLYSAYRLVWLYVYGEIPQGQIDHINGDRSDNRIENLRVTTFRENSQNRKEHRNGHLVGTYYDKQRKKWSSSIYINGERKYLGHYETQQEAHEAYINKLKELQNEKLFKC